MSGCSGRCSNTRTSTRAGVETMDHVVSWIHLDSMRSVADARVNFWQQSARIDVWEETVQPMYEILVEQHHKNRQPNIWEHHSSNTWHASAALKTAADDFAFICKCDPVTKKLCWKIHGRWLSGRNDCQSQDLCLKPFIQRDRHLLQFAFRYSVLIDAPAEGKARGKDEYTVHTNGWRPFWLNVTRLGCFFLKCRARCVAINWSFFLWASQKKMRQVQLSEAQPKVEKEADVFFLFASPICRRACDMHRDGKNGLICFFLRARVKEMLSQGGPTPTFWQGEREISASNTVGSLSEGPGAHRFPGSERGWSSQCFWCAAMPHRRPLVAVSVKHKAPPFWKKNLLCHFAFALNGGKFTFWGKFSFRGSNSNSNCVRWVWLTKISTSTSFRNHMCTTSPASFGDFWAVVLVLCTLMVLHT